MRLAGEQYKQAAWYVMVKWMTVKKQHEADLAKVTILLYL